VEGIVAKRTTRKPKAAPASESNSFQEGEQAVIENKPSVPMTTETTENGKSIESVVAPARVAAELTPLPPDPVPPISTPASQPTESEQKLLESAWPPPLYTLPNATLAEKYYLKQRWQSQWLWYDKKAAENKNKHQFLQVVIGVGSVAVPVLLGIEALRSYAVWVSLVVAAAASIENVKKYGDNWRSYRRAAENLSREKSLYDVNAGPYRTSKKPFARFVERCEEVIAQQNGQFYQREDQQTQTTQTTGQQGQGTTYQQTETDTNSVSG
jgi:hypothetical protein